MTAPAAEGAPVPRAEAEGAAVGCERGNQEGESVDRVRLAEIAEYVSNGDPAVAAELISAYLRETQADISRLREAVDDGNCGEIVRTAHKIGRSSRNLGVPRLGELAAEIESAGRSGRVNGGGEVMLLAIDNEYNRIFGILNLGFLTPESDEDPRR